MEVTVLETIGTIGAGGGGLAGIYLLGRGLWRMWSGQLEEQRLLLVDAREGRADIMKERDELRAQIITVENRCDEVERALRSVNDEVRDALHSERVKRRQWAEYASELRRKLIEMGVPLSELPAIPQGSIDKGLH